MPFPPIPNSTLANLQPIYMITEKPEITGIITFQTLIHEAMFVNVKK